MIFDDDDPHWMNMMTMMNHDRSHRIHPFPIDSPKNDNNPMTDWWYIERKIAK